MPGAEILAVVQCLDFGLAAGLGLYFNHPFLGIPGVWSLSGSLSLETTLPGGGKGLSSVGLLKEGISAGSKGSIYGLSSTLSDLAPYLFLILWYKVPPKVLSEHLEFCLEKILILIGTLPSDTHVSSWPQQFFLLLTLLLPRL